MLGWPKKTWAELVALGDLLQRGAGIGDRDEMPPGLLFAHRLTHPFEEVLLEDVGLERAAGLARHDEQRARRVDPALECFDLGRVGRSRAPGARAHCPGGRRSARALRDRGWSRPCRAAARGEKPAPRTSSANARSWSRRARCSPTMVEPAEPVRLVLAGPEAARRLPTDAGSCRACANPRALRLTAVSSVAGELVALPVEPAAEQDGALARDRAEQLVGGVGEQLHAVLDQLGGDLVDRDADARRELP